MHNEPLAFKMRPRTLNEIVGQQHILGKSTPLYKMIANGYVPSMLLYGPPGVGKTSIANAVAGTSKLSFFTLNATSAGKKDIEDVVVEARMAGKVLLFIDEIHRFNKLQQDTLLPHVENGSIVLIGATTENPFHDVNPAIRSRCGEILQLEHLKPDDIYELLQQAVVDTDRGLGKNTIEYRSVQLKRIAESANGDARKALSMLESIFYASEKIDGKTILSDDAIESIAKRIGVYGDKGGSHFYNLLSALQKSVRGSDVDAALYYLAHLLESGDIVAVCRRLLVMAYEDVGLANPQVGVHVQAATEAAVKLGMPEARIPLAVAICEMCLSDKSNSAYKALDAAVNAIHNGKTGAIPNHLKDAHYTGSATLGHVGYKYPHNTPIGTFGGWVDQQYLPDELVDTKFYTPVIAGEEKRMAAIYDKLQQFKKQS